MVGKMAKSKKVVEKNVFDIELYNKLKSEYDILKSQHEKCDTIIKSLELKVNDIELLKIENTNLKSEISKNEYNLQSLNECRDKDIKTIDELNNKNVELNNKNVELSSKIEELNKINDAISTQNREISQHNVILSGEKARNDSLKNIILNKSGKDINEIIPFIENLIAENNKIRNILVNKELNIEKLQNNVSLQDNLNSKLEIMRQELMEFKRNEMVLKATITNLTAKNDSLNEKIGKIKSMF
jgi:chromosome segregation ATPase